MSTASEVANPSSHLSTMNSVRSTPPAPSLQDHPTAPLRSRPEFEKIVIGPLMVLGEMSTGGHYLEVLRIAKQTQSSNANASYMSLHRGLVAETGFFGAFYRGMMPWGAIQCVKGLPVLFVQSEAKYQLMSRGLERKRAEPISGILGGMAQAVFVCPTQKLKVMVVSDPRLNAMRPFDAVKDIVSKFGMSTLADGLAPMMLRRGLDWCIRFTVSGEIKSMLVKRKVDRGESEQLALPELMGCGIIGGAFSAITHPIDCVITNAQKPVAEGFKTDGISVAKRMLKEGGPMAFSRGLGVKIVDNSYHTMWMYGVGTFVYDAVRRWSDGI